MLAVVSRSLKKVLLAWAHEQRAATMSLAATGSGNNLFVFALSD